MKKALVMGAGGFIGSHMVNRLKSEGYWVRGVDLKHTEFSPTQADDFIIGDLRDPKIVENTIEQGMDLVYQFAADMGGAGYIFTGDNDANVMHNSGLINLNVVHESVKKGVKKVFILLRHVCILLTTKKILTIQCVPKIAHILPPQTVNMDGKNCLVKDYIWHLQGTMV